MTNPNIAVIFGGQSNEYTVSLQSAAAVIDHIDRQRYTPVLIGITRKGAWYKYDGHTDRIRSDTWHIGELCTPAVLSPCRGDGGGLLALHNGEYSRLPVHAAFPVLHGRNGEDGRLQGLLELAGIPFVGCGMLASAVCMDKDLAHRLAELAGVRVPRSVALHRSASDAASRVAEAGLRYPLYVKPAKSGSSIGIARVTASGELAAALEQAGLHDDKLVIEEAVDGFEVGCALLGGDDPLVGDVDEIELAGGYFDFSEKYTLATSAIHMPARIDRETSERIRRTALHIYRALGCTGMARVDLFLTPEGGLVFNEVNTIPGFTATSRYPRMLAAAGLTYGGIVNRLLEEALAGGAER